MRVALLIVLTLLGSDVAFSATAPPMRVDPCSADVLAASVRSSGAVLHLLQSAFSAGGGMGRFYYQAYVPVCSAKAQNDLSFPEIKVTTPSKDETGLAAIRDALQGNPNVTVARDASGMPRVTVGTVHDVILRTRIAKISLSPEEQFNPVMAIGKILASPEVIEAMRVQGYTRLPYLYDMLVQAPMPGVPHLRSTITNVTLDQALDDVARTFKGMVLYGSCSQPRQLTVDFW
jgi:hypothetical protein